MKKLLLFFILFLFVGISFAQDKIPKKLMKNIETKIDEFSNIEIFYAKGCCLSIEKMADSINIYISLTATTWDSPMNLKKIYILVDGKSTIIEHNDNDFSHKEQSERVMTKGASGNFGTSSYKPAVFGNRMIYSDVWKTNASPYISLIESIIAYSGCKIKFEGENGDLFLDFKKKDVEKIKSVLDLYNFLKQSQ